MEDRDDPAPQDTPRLIDVAVPPRPEAVVLVLHGGGSRGQMATVSPTQLSVLRMIPIAHRVARAGRGRLAVLRQLNAYRGWGTHHTPVDDVAWALDRIAERFGAGMPVVLVGHSLGGRAALLAAGRPSVRGVVALAPWVLPADVGAGDLRDTPILIVHGDRDRVALPERSKALATALRRRGAGVSYVTVQGGTHAMLRRRDSFDGLAADAVRWMLFGDAPSPVVGRIAAGEPALAI